MIVSEACWREHPPQFLKCLQTGFILSETGLIIFGVLILPFSILPVICSPGNVKGANISPFGLSIIPSPNCPSRLTIYSDIYIIPLVLKIYALKNYRLFI